jgi:hypothetical protein
MAVGKLDQRARCISSSNANRTLPRCFESSVERNVFAAVTIRAVAVCASATIADRHINADAPMLRPVLIDKASSPLQAYPRSASAPSTLPRP